MKNKKVEKITKILANMGIWADNHGEKTILPSGFIIFDPIRLRKNDQYFYLEVIDLRKEGLAIVIFDNQGEIIDLIENQKTQTATLMQLTYILGRLGF